MGTKFSAMDGPGGPIFLPWTFRGGPIFGGTNYRMTGRDEVRPELRFRGNRKGRGGKCPSCPSPLDPPLRMRRLRTNGQRNNALFCTAEIQRRRVCTRNLESCTVYPRDVRQERNDRLISMHISDTSGDVW